MSFQYDSLHRLTRVDYDNGASIAYTYDSAGNRLTLMSQIAAQPTDFTYTTNNDSRSPSPDTSAAAVM